MSAANRAIALPPGNYWGDLLIDPSSGDLLLPLRGKQPEVIRMRPDTSTSQQMVLSGVREARLRLLHPAGFWLITTPTEPMALFAVDRETGKVRWRFEVPGRFDPDTRLALALDADGTILLAGCGYPSLVRLSSDGQLLLDYYALSPAHARDFAWRGVVSVVPGLNGRVYLVDRNMYGAVLVIDPQAGHLGDIGQRAAQTMSTNPDGLQSPSCAIPDGEGGLWILELAIPQWSRYNDSGRLLDTIAISATPAHYFDQEQGLRWNEGLATCSRQQNRWHLILSGMRD